MCDVLCTEWQWKLECDTLTLRANVYILRSLTTFHVVHITAARPALMTDNTAFRSICLTGVWLRRPFGLSQHIPAEESGPASTEVQDKAHGEIATHAGRKETKKVLG